MSTSSLDTFLNTVLNSQPKDWLKLTTHRLDVYNEGKAKIEFLEEPGSSITFYKLGFCKS
jgi:hypothetical protein